MRKLAIILISLGLCVFIGCSSNEVIKHNYTYTGENEFWSAEYEVSGMYDKMNNQSSSDVTLVVIYKGDISDLVSVKQLKISSVSSSKILSINHSYDTNPSDEKTFVAKSSGQGIENKDEIVKVKITLDGQTQTLELRNEQ